MDTVELQTVNCKSNDRRGQALILNSSKYILAMLTGGSQQLKLFETEADCDLARAAIRAVLHAMNQLQMPVLPRVKKMLDPEGKECYVIEIYVPLWQNSLKSAVRLLLIKDKDSAYFSPCVFYSSDEADAIAGDIVETLADFAVDWTKLINSTFVQ